MAISCHDFVAEAGGGEQFRTKADVRAKLIDRGYIVSERTEASTLRVANVLFGSSC